jgi:hypothetical protein
MIARGRRGHRRDGRARSRVRRLLPEHPAADAERMRPGGEWVEKRFNLAAFNPPAPMFGTADFVAYDAATKTLHVVDLKYGQGVVVEVDRQPAAPLLRARCRALDAEPGTEIESVHITIVQPRAGTPTARSAPRSSTTSTCIGWSGELLERRAQDDRARRAARRRLALPLVPRASPVPREARARARRRPAGVQRRRSAAPFTPPVPALIPDEQFFEMLQQARRARRLDHRRDARARERHAHARRRGAWVQARRTPREPALGRPGRPLSICSAQATPTTRSTSRAI